MTARGADIQWRIPLVFELPHVFKGPVLVKFLRDSV